MMSKDKLCPTPCSNPKEDNYSWSLYNHLNHKTLINKKDKKKRKKKRKTQKSKTAGCNKIRTTCKMAKNTTKPNLDDKTGYFFQ